MDDCKRLQEYRMPGEFEPHDGCLMIWPVRPGSWNYGGREAKKAFCAIMEELVKSETVYLLVDSMHLSEAKEMVPNQVRILEIETDDAWARDVGPTFVVGEKDRIGIDWEFNAWGGTVDGLYIHWERDDRAAGKVLSALGEKRFDAHPFVLEGGSIHSDGQGTILTTEACLLSKGRNPELLKEEIEQILCDTLGGKKVIWLPHGILNDETNEHVDNVCAFVKPGEVVLAWTDDETDPQFAYSKACEEVLLSETDACGRTFTIHHLPIPKEPITIREEDLLGYEFEEGEDVREIGERLAASYVNFYISNDAIIMPQFGDEMDETAARILKELFSHRRIIGIQARSILLGGGNIHCITQQIPKV